MLGDIQLSPINLEASLYRQNINKVGSIDHLIKGLYLVLCNGFRKNRPIINIIVSVN